MTASFNMHITFLSFAQSSGLWYNIMCSNNSALFILVTFENDIIYYQLCMYLLTTFITLTHPVWCDHLTNDTNPTIQQLYPTVCVFAYSQYVCRHVQMYEHTVSVYLLTPILYPTHGSGKSRCVVISGAPEEPPPYYQTAPQNQHTNTNFT
jgi:hypothetical protein